jgi:extracellular factor (EF) 3-hydroxypalmitic acid methyl ester biosynthesis protein
MGTGNSASAGAQSSNGEVKDSLVLGHTNQGGELRASLLRLTRYQAVFELYGSGIVLRASEVIRDFKIIINDLTIYAGRAVISNLVHTGTVIVCEVSLDEAGFNIASFSPLEPAERTREGFNQFLTQWQKIYKVLPEFKVVVADMQTFLTDLRLWVEQVELEIRSAPAGDRLDLEQRTVQQLGESMVPAFDAMHERLEALAGGIEEELRPVHQNFSKRQLHPLMLSSPFAYRAYHKPLGYAGDYEMINMIVRNPFEGASLFAKLVNLWFLSQWPAKAHRNRIQHLGEVLIRESLRGARRGKPIQILNMGCGPAREVQDFLKHSDLCEHAEFTLLDFNVETIEHTVQALDNAKQNYGRRTRIQIQKKSVHQVLKEGHKPTVGDNLKKYDLIYCTGLFDYLSDHTCKQLMRIFYNWLNPDGLLVASNAVDCKPFRHMLEFVLDWHLIYRDTKRARCLIPPDAAPEGVQLMQDRTGVNLFVELRRRDHA